MPFVRREFALMLALPLASGFGLGVAACGGPAGDSDGDGDGDTGDGDAGDGDGDGDAGDGDGGNPCEAGAPGVLYSQGTRDAINAGVLAGTFTDINGYSVELADDFDIPQDDSCWCITEIVARGFYTDAILPANMPSFFV